MLRAPSTYPMQVSILALAPAIYLIGAFRPFDIAVTELYVIVILFSARVCARTGQLLVISACMAMTIVACLAFDLAAFPGRAAGHCLISLGVLGIAGCLVMADRAAADVLRQRDQSLRRSEALLAAAQRLSQTGSVSFHVASGRMQWSEEAAHIFGQPVSAELSPAMLLAYIPAADIDLLRRAFEKSRADDSIMDVRHRLSMPDGKTKQVRVLARAIADVEGGLEYFAAIMDVTAEYAAERDGYRAPVQSAYANRAGIDALTASIAHEINQPLAAISMNGGACLRWIDRAEPNLPEARASVERMLEACRHAGEMIGRIRTMAARADQPLLPVDPSDSAGMDERAQLTVGPVP
jgi:two-component system sensor kinase FixL